MSESILINVLCYNFVIARKATGTEKKSEGTENMEVVLIVGKEIKK